VPIAGGKKVFNWFLCWWFGHEWMPGYEFIPSEMNFVDRNNLSVGGIPKLKDYACARCGKVISRDEYDQWERKI
jgi:hypothetical protein